MAIKGIHCELVPVSLLNGESESPQHLARNPLGYVPVLERLDLDPQSPRRYLTESIAILEWLDESYPGPKLLPIDPWMRAHARALAETVNADTQPIQNLAVQLRHSSDPVEQKKWAQHWIQNGLSAYEKLCATTQGKFSVGDELTIADLCLIPQVFNAHRFEVPLTDFPRVVAIDAAAKQTASYRVAEPEAHRPPDA